MKLGDYPVSATVPVTDLNRAAKFYGEVLGLREIFSMENEIRTYECGAGTRLEVYRTRGGIAAGHTECGWLVDDIDAVVAQLRDAGVTFDDYDLGEGATTEGGIATVGDDRAAWFKDPDGNVLAVFQSPHR
jgi:catechol 2,3-dioxygenase-like lactoylglutathione lyase family enzyme